MLTKKVCHFVWIVIPLMCGLFFLNIFIIVFYYLRHLAEIFVNKKFKYYWLKFILWIIAGPFILIVLALIDNYNVINIVTDYDYKER